MEKAHSAVVRTPTVIAVYTLLSVLSSPARAEVFAFTSFEEPGGISGKYTDTGDSAVDHALVNNPGQPLVNWTKTGPELGFSSFYKNTRNGEGLTDGDPAGVTDYSTNVSAYTDGKQGFRISDADGLMTTTLDEVPLIGHLNPTVSLDVFIAETGWETNDRLRVWATADGGSEIDLFNTSGVDIDTLGVEGTWQAFSVDLTGYSAATLAFELDSNAEAESVYFDNVKFEETVVPLPSSLVLGSLGICFAAYFRKS